MVRLGRLGRLRSIDRSLYSRRGWVLSAAAGALMLGGCRQDMHDQPKYIPLRSSRFYADGRSARGQVEGTVARSQGDADSYFNTGMQDGKEGEAFPFKVTPQILERGQERFNIYCTPCHSRTGNGQGILFQRGYYQPANFHSDRLRQAPVGHFFNVITHGLGPMPEYRMELAPADRWAVIAYIRALQLSQYAKREDAAGHPVRSLPEVATEEGLPASFAGPDWGRPVFPVPEIPSVARPRINSTSQPSPPGDANTAAAPGGKPALGMKAPAGGNAPAAAARAGNAAAGKKLYVNNCQMCHQPTRQGLPPVIPSLVGIVGRVGAPHIRQTVTNGVPTGNPPMPSFAGKLSPADIDNLIAFLKTKP